MYSFKIKTTGLSCPQVHRLSGASKGTLCANVHDLQQGHCVDNRGAGGAHYLHFCIAHLICTGHFNSNKVQKINHINKDKFCYSEIYFDDTFLFHLHRIYLAYIWVFPKQFFIKSRLNDLNLIKLVITIKLLPIT